MNELTTAHILWAAAVVILLVAIAAWFDARSDRDRRTGGHDD